MKIKVFCVFFVLISLNAWAQLPYLHSPTSTSIYIGWKSETTGAPSVEYGLNSGNLNLVESGTSQEFATNYHWHLVKLTNLTPNTAYSYRVKTGAAASNVFRFKSQPIEGTKTGHYRFLILGDHQVVGDNRYLDLINAAKAKVIEKYGSPVEDHINILINAGDQVNTSNLNEWENLHFNQSAPLMSNIPVMTVIGNHEYLGGVVSDLYWNHFVYDDAQTLYKQMKGSDGEHYYAFQVANILFVMLNSNTEYGYLTPEFEQRQLDWIEQISNAAKTDNNIEWLFSDCHHPIYSEQYPGDARSYSRDKVLPLLKSSNKMTMYISGHSNSMYSRGALKDEAIYHIISGGAAWNQRWGDVTPVNYPLVQKTLERHNYQIVDIDLANQEMIVETYTTGQTDITLNNELIDSYYLKLKGVKPNTPTLDPIPTNVTLPLTVSGSVYSGSEPLNSSHIQVALNGDFENSQMDKLRDFEDLYLSSGLPNLTPIDQLNGVDISKLVVTDTDLFKGNNQVRIRYRDKSMHWSDWSPTLSFIADNGLNPPRQDKIAYFPFNGNADDESGIGKNGVPSGVGFITDSIQGEVANLDGSAIININSGATDGLDIPKKELTIGLWVKVNTTVQYGGFYGVFQDNGSTEEGWLLGHTDNNFSFALSSKDASTLTYLQDPDPFTPNQWYHVAATYNGNTMKLYVNGILKAITTAQSGDILYPASADYQIGSYKDSNEDFRLSGCLDEVSLWERTLSAVEILSLYNSGTVPILNNTNNKINLRYIHASPTVFNHKTKLSYLIPGYLSGGANELKIKVYSMKGLRVRTLINTKSLAGQYEIFFDGKDDFGTLLPTGNYIVRFSINKLARSILVHKLN